MINFNSLQLVVHEKYSFVGIEKREGKLFFCLPKGFNNQVNNLNKFDKKRDLFFLLYKAFTTFKQICLEKGYLKDSSTNSTCDRDGVIKITNGSGIQSIEEDSENIFYSKLDFIGSILNSYDELKVLALVYRLGKSEAVDLSQIHRFLHKATFLPNGVVYVDSMTLPRQEIHFELTDIAAMYCYILVEIKQQLKESVNTEIKTLAERFKQIYIKAEYSFFEEDYWEVVTDILKDALEIIDRNTPFKDKDYYQLYEAIELFLYGDLSQSTEGEIWGIKNFYSVWESLCLTYLTQTTPPAHLLYLDRHFVSDRIVQSVMNNYKVFDVSKTFLINKLEPELVPDAVLFFSISDHMPKKKEYKIWEYLWNSESPWSDNNYYITFKGLSHIRYFKVASIGQTTGIHTINLLKDSYVIENHQLIINKPLPDNYYAFWKIPENLDIEHLCKLYYFNHVFYVAIARGISSWQKFKSEILDEILGVTQDTLRLSSDDSRANVFTHGVFAEHTFEDIEQMFCSFIEKYTVSKFKEVFKIIDIKYYDYDYFLDPEHIEELQSRSIRKQFVYEYLLEKSVKKVENKYSQLSIRSSFWIPAYLENSKIFECDQNYLGGYINLTKVNLATLISFYLV